MKGVGTKDEIVYDLRHFERDFNGTEQVNGLELALAEPKKDIRIKMLANEQREAGIPYVSGQSGRMIPIRRARYATCTWTKHTGNGSRQTAAAQNLIGTDIAAIMSPRFSPNI